MIRIFASVVILLSSSFAFANLEIAALGQLSRTHFDATTSTSFSDSNNTKLGILVLFPIIPELSFRTGLISESRSVSGHVSFFDEDATQKDSLIEIPLNVQVNLPLTDLYAFGGLMYYTTQSTDCSPDSSGCDHSRTSNDTALNIGLGYNLVSVAVFRLGIEGEYERSLSSNTIKQNEMNLGLIAAFGF